MGCRVTVSTHGTTAPWAETGPLAVLPGATAPAHSVVKHGPPCEPSAQCGCQQAVLRVAHRRACSVWLSPAAFVRQSSLLTFVALAPAAAATAGSTSSQRRSLCAPTRPPQLSLPPRLLTTPAPAPAPTWTCCHRTDTSCPGAQPIHPCRQRHQPWDPAAEQCREHKGSPASPASSAPIPQATCAQPPWIFQQPAQSAEPTAVFTTV